MTYFARTTIDPATLLLDGPGIVEKYTQVLDGGYVILGPEIMQTETKLMLRERGLNPYFIAVFGGLTQNVASESWVHTDLTRTDPKPWRNYEPAEGKSWKRIICALNYELVPCVNTLSWYEVDELELWPDKPCKTRHDYLNGIHYGERVRKGLYPTMRLLASVETSTCETMLVRTDLPHLALYKAATPRFGVSIRFRETWANWDEAVTAFTAAGLIA